MGSQNASFLGIGNSTSRDGSMPPSRASDSGMTGGSLSFANGNPHFGSIGHTPNSSIHSQRQSFSGLSGSFPSQPNGSRFTELNQAEVELREKFAGFGFGGDVESGTASQINSNLGPTYSPGHPNYSQGLQLNAGSAMWNDSPKAFQNYDNYTSQAFADQPYFNKGSRFGDRGSVSPAGSDYRRGLNSPKYYSAAGTPPAGSEQIYRPGSRGPRVPQGPIELDRRLQQNIHYAQQQNYLYSHPFHGQYPPQAYDYPSHTYRQSAVPYGYPMPMPPYAPNQVIPTRPAKDQDVGVGVRSVLLEEFRSNSKSTKRYELKVGFYHS
jgi:mRNA-binding protein PUF3